MPSRDRRADLPSEPRRIGMPPRSDDGLVGARAKQRSVGQKRGRGTELRSVFGIGKK